MVAGEMEKPGPHTDPLLSPPIYGIPAPFPNPQPPAYIILPIYPHRRRRRRCSACCSTLLSSSSLLALTLLLTTLAAASFFFYPSEPKINIARLRLDRIHISPFPLASINIALNLDLMIQNRDFFSLDYRSIKVDVGYRGQHLGAVTSGGGRVRARGVSYVEAELRVDGVRVINEIFYLIEDLASGSVPFDTVTEVQGKIHLFFFDIPIQGSFSCAVHVNPENQTVVHQDCYPPKTRMTSSV